MFEHSILSQRQQDELLARSESHFFDFKRSQIAPGKLAATLVAFANADGGEVLVGVDEDKRLQPKDRLFGFPSQEAANSHIAVAERDIDPPIPGATYAFLSFPIAPAQLVLQIVVPKSPRVHYTPSRECFLRRGAQNLPLRPRDIERLLFSKGQVSYEDTIAEMIRLKDIEESGYLAQYLQVVPTAQPIEIFLRKQRLLESDAQSHFRGPRILVAGVLLFDEQPQASLSTKCSIKISRLETNAVEYRREYLKGVPLTMEGPIEILIRQSVQQVRSIMQSVKYKVGKSYRSLRYPTEAIHEIVTNAILHRDYSIKDDVHVNIYDNRIEVISPGRLPGHVTKENILNERYARNPKIVRLINKLPDPPNRDIGEGLNTAFTSMERARLAPPEIDELDNAVRVTLRHDNIASPESQIIRFLQEKQSTVRNAEARSLTGIMSEKATTKVLARMRKYGLIEPVDAEASTYEYKYKLKSGWEEVWNERKEKLGDLPEPGRPS